MTDFGTMKNNVLDDINRTGELTAVAERQIKAAIAHYEKRRFWFLEQRATLDTVADQEFYGLPSDFLDDDSLVIEVNSNAYPLIKRTYQTIEDWFIETSSYTGYPTDYAIYDEQIRLYPVPNGAYTMTLSYIKQLASLSAEGDTNSWMTDGEALIRARAEWLIWAQNLRDYDAAQVCKRLEMEALAECEKLTKARLMTGRTRKRRM